MKKKLGIAVLLTLIILIVPNFVTAAVIGGVNNPIIDGSKVKTEFWIKNTGLTTERLVVEVAANPIKAYSVLTAGLENTCDNSNPNNVHREISLSPGETVRTSITTPAYGALSNGLYQMMILSVNKCCPSGGCFAVEPWNWGVPIGFAEIKTGTTCTSHYRYDCYFDDAVWWNSCGAREELKQDCKTGCKEGVCVDEGGNPEELRGTFSNIQRPEKVAVGDQIVTTGTFTAQTKGTYLLEAGLLQPVIRTLAQTIEASRSACDGDIHYASNRVDLAAGESVNFKFTIRDYGESGVYVLGLGAFNGCSAALGPNFKVVTTSDTRIQVGEPKPSPVTYVVVLIIVVLVAGAVFWLLTRKKKK